MSAPVVEETYFGNSRRGADIVADVLRFNGIDTEVISVENAPSEIQDDIDLLVSGAPTHNVTSPRKRPGRPLPPESAASPPRGCQGMGRAIGGTSRPAAGRRVRRPHGVTHGWPDQRSRRLELSCLAMASQSYRCAQRSASRTSPDPEQ